MELILVFAGLLLLSYILGKVSDRRRYRRECELVDELAPDLASLVDNADGIDIQELRSRLEATKNLLARHMAVLVDSEGEVINRCPKCGATLTLRNTKYYGQILGCPNYPDCRHYLRVADLDRTVLPRLQD